MERMVYIFGVSISTPMTSVVEGLKDDTAFDGFNVIATDAATAAFEKASLRPISGGESDSPYCANSKSKKKAANAMIIMC